MGQQKITLSIICLTLPATLPWSAITALPHHRLTILADRSIHPTQRLQEEGSRQILQLLLNLFSYKIHRKAPSLRPPLPPWGITILFPPFPLFRARFHNSYLNNRHLNHNLNTSTHKTTTPLPLIIYSQNPNRSTSISHPCGLMEINVSDPLCPSSLNRFQHNCNTNTCSCNSSCRHSICNSSNCNSKFNSNTNFNNNYNTSYTNKNYNNSNNRTIFSNKSSRNNKRTYNYNFNNPNRILRLRQLGI